MYSTISRRAVQRVHTTAERVALTVLCLAACSPGDPGVTGVDPDPSDGSGADTTPPSVVSSSPAHASTGVGVDVAVSVTFSEPIDPSTVDASSFSLGAGVSGSVSAAGNSATFRPDAALAPATTYVATIAASVADTAGNAMGSEHTIRFTTEAPPAPAFSFPFEAGKRWLYETETQRTVVGSSIGVRSESWSGDIVLVVDKRYQFQGRSAWRLVRYDVESTPGDEPFSREVIWVSESADDLSRWVPSTTGGSWSRIASTRDASFQSNHFLLAGNPRGPTTTMSASTATVPAGAFSTLRAHVDFSQTGQYVAEDIFEKRNEHYADGVGLVRASWDFDFDDNDPSAWDVYEDGVIELTHVDTGPFPALVPDSDASTGPNLAQPLILPAIAEGEAAMTDAGTVISSPDVHPNAGGQALLQDWYRLTLTSSRQIRLDLVYDGYTNGAFNDLDLYLFQQTGGSLAFVAASTNPQNEPEWMQGTLPAGTYYIAVQAWSTPTGSVEYAFHMR